MDRKYSIEDELVRFMVNSYTKFDAVNATLRNDPVSIQSLENQDGQLAKANSERPLGSIPRNIEANLREQLKAITLRSGREVETQIERGSSVKYRKLVEEDAISEDEVVIEESNNKWKKVQRLQPPPV